MYYFVAKQTTCTPQMRVSILIEYVIVSSSGNQCFISIISHCHHAIYGISYCQDLIYKSISKTPMSVCHGIWYGVLQDHHQAGGM